MDELEKLALEEEIDRLRHLLLVKEMQIVVLETELEQAETASTRAFMLMMGAVGVNPSAAEVALMTPVDVH